MYRASFRASRDLDVYVAALYMSQALRNKKVDLFRAQDVNADQHFGLEIVHQVDFSCEGGQDLLLVWTVGSQEVHW